MSAILCAQPTSRECECVKDPVSNFSLEDDDFLTYAGISDPPPPPPPLGDEWTAQGCLTLCRSRVSQADADLCAQQQAALCQQTHIIDPGGDPVPIYYNSQQSCVVYCPDGLPFSYTVAAGRYSALTQAEADRLATAEACAGARASRICLSSPTLKCCENKAFDATITASSLNRVSFVLNTGAFPLGVHLYQDGTMPYTARITGTPTETGTFTFSIRATDGSGNYMVKSYTMIVEGVTPDTLPDGTVGTAYSETLAPAVAAGVTAPVTWYVSSGSLPPGLTLDAATGEISGTPTTAGTYDFTVTMRDSSA